MVDPLAAQGVITLNSNNSNNNNRSSNGSQPPPQRNNMPPPPPPAPHAPPQRAPPRNVVPAGNIPGPHHELVRAQPTQQMAQAQAEEQRMHDLSPAGRSAPLDLQKRQAVEISDIRRERMTEADAREVLSEYVVIRFEKLDDENRVDEEGHSTLPTWEQAVKTEVRDLSKQEITHLVRDLDRTGKSVGEKKADLTLPLQRQLELAQDKLAEAESEPLSWQYVLVQMDSKLRRFEKRADEYYVTKNHRGSKKLVISRRASSKPKDNRHRPKWERISLTAFFRRTPRAEVNALALLNQREQRSNGVRIAQPQHRALPAPFPQHQQQQLAQVQQDNQFSHPRPIPPLEVRPQRPALEAAPQLPFPGQAQAGQGQVQRPQNIPPPPPISKLQVPPQGPPRPKGQEQGEGQGQGQMRQQGPPQNMAQQMDKQQGKPRDMPPGIQVIQTNKRGNNNNDNGNKACRDGQRSPRSLRGSVSSSGSSYSGSDTEDTPISSLASSSGSSKRGRRGQRSQSRSRSYSRSRSHSRSRSRSRARHRDRAEQYGVEAPRRHTRGEQSYILDPLSPRSRPGRTSPLPERKPSPRLVQIIRRDAYQAGLADGDRNAASWGQGGRLPADDMAYRPRTALPPCVSQPARRSGVRLIDPGRFEDELVLERIEHLRLLDGEMELQELDDRMRADMVENEMRRRDELRWRYGPAIDDRFRRPFRDEGPFSPVMDEDYHQPWEDREAREYMRFGERLPLPAEAPESTFEAFGGRGRRNNFHAPAGLYRH